MNKKFLLVLTAAAVLTAGGALFAKDKPDGKDAGGPPAMGQDQGSGPECPMKDGKKGPPGNDGPGVGGPGMGPMAGHMGMGMGIQMKLKFALDNPELKKELNLTADQESKLDALQVDLEKFTIQKRADIQLASVDLEQEFKKDTVDVKKVQDLSDKISAAGAELFKKNMTAAAEIMNILTKDQRQKLEQMRAEHRDKMMKKFKENRK